MEAHSKTHKVHEIMMSYDYNLEIKINDKKFEYLNKNLQELLKTRSQVIKDYRSVKDFEQKLSLIDMFTKLNHDICLILGIII